MILEDFVQFVASNWELHDNIRLSDHYLVFFILKNLYHEILPNIKEFSVLDQASFDNVVEKFVYNPKNLRNSKNVLPKKYRTCLFFSRGNSLLTQPQKDFLILLLTLECPKIEGINYFEKLKMYNSKEQGGNFLYIHEAHIHDVVKTLLSLSGNKKPLSFENLKLCKSKLEKERQMINTREPSFALNSFLRNESYKPLEYKMVSLSLNFFLLHVNPSFGNIARTLSEELKKVSREKLFQATLMVNELIKLYPTEQILWEIKTLITDLWFKRFKITFVKYLSTSKKGIIVKKTPENTHYKFLVKLIFKLFKDKMLMVDQPFIAEVFFIKNFNNCVTTYLKNQYDSVFRHVFTLYMDKIKAMNLGYFNKFEEFNCLGTHSTYRITFLNALYKFFSSYYKRLLTNFSFPGLFILLVNMIKKRTYNQILSTSISYDDLYTSSFLFTRLNEDLEDNLTFCDQMIKKDYENCWIDNKSKLLTFLLDFHKTLRPFYPDKELVNSIFEFKLVVLFNQHFSTWASFSNILSKVYHTFPNLYNNRSIQINTERKKPSRFKRVKIGHFHLDQYKSESVFIRNLLYEDTTPLHAQQAEGYGFVNIRYINLESLKICQKYNDLQIDNIINGFNQLLYLLFYTLRSIASLKSNPKFDINLKNFKILFETIKLVFKYSKLVPKLGTKANVLLGIGIAKKMERHSRHLSYKYYKILNTEDVPYYLDRTLTKLCLLMLSSPFRFYLHWILSSQPKLELVYKQVMKLK